MDTNKNGYEVRDVDIPRVTMLAGVLVAVLVAVLGLMLWMFNYLAAREARQQPPSSPLAGQSGVQLPPEPRLQDSPLQDLREMRAEEEALLESYGWIDRSAGVARIPVDEAMRLIARRGLPSRPAPAGGRRSR